MENRLKLFPNLIIRPVGSYIFLIVLSITFLILFSDIIITVVKRWFLEPHFYGQGAIFLGISLYMVYKKRSYLKTILVRPKFIPGIFIVVLGCFMLYSGKVTDTQTLYEISIVVAIIGIIWASFGSEYLKSLFIPIIFLFFIFPIFDVIPGPHIAFLQKTSAIIGSIIISLVNITVYRNGYVLELPHITLSVAKACAGINHIMSLTTLAFFIGYLKNISRNGIILLIIISLIIGMLLNGIRIGLIGIWTYYFRGSDVHGPADTLLVSFIFLFGLLFLMFIVKVFAKYDKKKINRHSQIVKKKKILDQSSKRKFAVITIIISIAFISTAVLKSNAKVDPVFYKDIDKYIPMSIGAWSGRHILSLNEKFEKIKTDYELKRVYTDSNGSIIELYIAYFAIQDDKKNVFNPTFNALLNYSQDVHRIILNNENDRKDNQQKIELNNHRDQKYLYAAYVVDGKLYLNQYAAKIAIFKNILFKKKNNAAIIIISANRHKNNNKASAIKKEELIIFLENAIPFFKNAFNPKSLSNKKMKKTIEISSI